MPHPHDRAIVIGGSLAGLWTARVLADHFRHVTVLERDLLPEGPASRPGVPQDRHVHVLLQRGAIIMGRLLPGIEGELMAAGAHRVDLAMDAMARIRGRWLPRFPSDKVTYACSRVLLESVLRRRVAALPNVTLNGSARAVGLIEDGGRVSGVQVHWKERGEDTVEAANFVVDASGRSSKTPEWLAALDYGRPAETVIDVRLGYAGRRYKMPGDPAPPAQPHTGASVDWSIMLVGQDPPRQSRAGLIYGEEDGVWMVMLAGILGDYPPTDEEGFLAFAATVDPAFHAAIRAAEPASSIFGYRKTENRFRHYEKLARWPDRFVVLGDAVCGFNPIYGQGMTVAAIAAENLGRALARSDGRLDGLARRFQQDYPGIVAPAWLLATNADLEWLDRQEAPSPSQRLAGWYLPRFLDTVPADRLVHETFLEVQNLMQPATALFRPRVALRVLRHHLRKTRPVPAAENLRGGLAGSG